MKNEADVGANLLLTSPMWGWRLFRNNSGMAYNPNGKPVRFGLGNVSEKFNKEIKTSDYIGLNNTGQFIAIEVKRPEWCYGVATGKKERDRERAQCRFLHLVNKMGGIAYFYNGTSWTLPPLEAQK